MTVRPLLVALLLLASPAAAQQAKAPSADAAAPPIVVTGRKPGDPASIRRQTRAVAVAVGGQIARFAAPVCADATGLPPDLDAKLAARIMADAAAAGVAVAKPGCRANLIVAMVPNGQQALRALAAGRRPLLAGFDAPTLKALLADAGPAHVMTLTSLRSRDGSSLYTPPPGNGQKEAPVLIVDNASILGPPTRQDIDGALILLDQDALTGKTLRQIADYAAMRTLAMTRTPPATPAGDTILTLFVPGDTAPPPALTAFDAAYLRNLYHAPATRTDHGTVATIAAGIGRGGPGGE